jgi:uncharacterized Zn-finger protein/predicted small lipoprotein YifL
MKSKKTKQAIGLFLVLLLAVCMGISGCGKKGNTSADTSAKSTAGKSTDKSSDKDADKSEKKTADKSAEASSEKSSEKSSAKSGKSAGTESSGKSDSTSATTASGYTCPYCNLVYEGSDMSAYNDHVVADAKSHGDTGSIATCPYCGQEYSTLAEDPGSSGESLYESHVAQEEWANREYVMCQKCGEYYKNGTEHHCENE